MKKAAPPPETSATAPGPGAPAPRRRFRASDVAEHLDMVVIGEVCLGVTLAGYQSVLRGFLDDPGGSLASLLSALDAGDTTTLHARAHAVKGGAASLGLRSLYRLTAGLESTAEGGAPLDAPATAATLRALTGTARGLLQRMGLL